MDVRTIVRFPSGEAIFLQSVQSGSGAYPAPSVRGIDSQIQKFYLKSLFGVERSLDIFMWRRIKLWKINFLLWRCNPTRIMAPPFLMFLDHTKRRTTVGRTPLDEWSARRRDLYLKTHNTHNTQISMPRRDSNPQSQQASGRRPMP